MLLSCDLFISNTFYYIFIYYYQLTIFNEKIVESSAYWIDKNGN